MYILAYGYISRSNARIMRLFTIKNVFPINHILELDYIVSNRLRDKSELIFV
jgi:hypothetical protein